MRIRFQADADLNQNIVAAVVRHLPEADFLTATAAGLAGLHDVDVLARAAAAGRVLVTHDKNTMPTHFATFIAKAESSGVIIVRQSLPIATVLEDLALIWSASQAEEWRNRIVHLPL